MPLGSLIIIGGGDDHHPQRTYMECIGFLDL